MARTPNWWTRNTETTATPAVKIRLVVLMQKLLYIQEPFIRLNLSYADQPGFCHDEMSGVLERDRPKKSRHRRVNQVAAEGRRDTEREARHHVYFGGSL